MKNTWKSLCLLTFLLFSLTFFTNAQTETSLEVSIESDSVVQGESFCLDVRVKGFEDLLGIQFGIRWDETVLLLESIGGLDNSPIHSGHFGQSQINDGKLFLVWVDEDSNGASMPDNAVIFQLCFKAIRHDIGSTLVHIDENILMSEVVTTNLEVIPLTASAGLVTIGDGVYIQEVGLQVSSTNGPKDAIRCVAVKADGLRGVNGVDYNMVWDSTLLEFTGTEGYNLPALNAENFSLLNAGRLSMDWEFPGNFGYTAENGTALHRVCFQALGETGQSSSIRLENVEVSTPLADSLIITASEGIFNITHQAGSDAFTLVGNSIVVGQTQTGCVDVSVRNFTDIVGYQHTMVFDTSKLEFERITIIDETLGLRLNNFGINNGQPERGEIPFSWASEVPLSTNVADNTVLYSICFSAIGNEGDTTLVLLDGLPDWAEAIQMTVQGNIELIDFHDVPAQIIIGERSQFVLPGDTDVNDNINHFDLLNIGLGYGFSGPARENASIEAIPQSATDWETTTPASSINFKHSDTDGNGFIDSNDTLALVQNWGFELNGLQPTEIDDRTEKAPFYVLPDTLVPGETIALPVILGSTDYPAENVYGLAFSLLYDTAAIVAGSVHIEFDDSWMGTIGEDMISVQKEFSEAGRLDVAVTRIDGEHTRGIGKLADLYVTIEDVIFLNPNEVEDRSEGYELHFQIENIRLISPEEEEQEVDNPETIVTITDETTAVTKLLEDDTVKIYPNPVRAILNLEVEKGSMEFLQVFNNLGQLVQTLPASTALNVKHLPNGAYTLHIQSKKGKVVKPFVVVH